MSILDFIQAILHGRLNNFSYTITEEAEGKTLIINWKKEDGLQQSRIIINKPDKN